MAVLLEGRDTVRTPKYRTAVRWLYAGVWATPSAQTLFVGHELFELCNIRCVSWVSTCPCMDMSTMYAYTWAQMVVLFFK